MSATCHTCHRPFTPQRSTARFCGDACRKVAQRNRDRGVRPKSPATAPAVAVQAILSVTGAQETDNRPLAASVTLISQQPPASKAAPKLDPRIVRDAAYPTMYRIRLCGGGLSEMVNLTRAKDAFEEMRGRR